MAAPASKTIQDLNGKWLMNKTLSNSPEPTLQLQGIGYLTRKAVNLASVTIDVKQYEAAPAPPNDDKTPVVHIDIVQTVSSLASSEEKRNLDNVERPHSDFLFGDCIGQTRWVTLAEIDDPYLAANWEPADRYVLNYVESVNKGWKGTQIWGFQEVEGVRRHCRNIVVTKGDERTETRLVYDWQG